MSKNTDKLQVATAAEIEDDAYIVARFGDHLMAVINALGEHVAAFVVSNVVNRGKTNENRTNMITMRALTREGQHLLSNDDSDVEIRHFNYGLDLDLRRAVAQSKRENFRSSADVMEKTVKFLTEKLGETREAAIAIVEASPTYVQALEREADGADEADENDESESAEEVSA